MAEEVFPWLKSLPLAPEYHPTLTEFQDPIAYILKIEEEASMYGICKIIPPVPTSPKKTIIANLNRSLASQNPHSSPTFDTSLLQVGFNPRNHRRPVQKSIWESGQTYTLPQFEAKDKRFQKKKGSKGLSPLEVETLYWKAETGREFGVEYGNDLPGSAFQGMGGGGVDDTPWNMRRISRAKGSLLKFLRAEVPGVTSPMVYIGMMFSWFAWHVEDHDLHSLNYMHKGAAKTWYGVPQEAAPAFEDVVRIHGYGGEINLIEAFATLTQKTTVMSPKILLKLGVPCCRLVQNAGEFVVTFPRAYHSGFSHGFNIGEATNFATPEWLKVAREAAIRRTSIISPPMVAHTQLLYHLAVSLSSSLHKNTRHEPRSSQLKDRLKLEGEFMVKQLFLEDIMENYRLLRVLAKGSHAVLLSKDSLDGLVSSDSCFASPFPRTQSLIPKDVDTGPGREEHSSLDKEHVIVPDPSLISCVSCGVCCYPCFAIVQPTEAAAHRLMSVTSDPKSFPECEMPKRAPDGNCDRMNSENKKLAMDSNCSRGTFEFQTEVNDPSPASRMQVFCLAHAFQVQHLLSRFGRAHILLICHHDFQKFDTETRLIAHELGTDDTFAYMELRKFIEQDKEKIESAIHIAEGTHGPQDWTVKLGFNIIHSATLSRSPLYSKQVPYNSVIYNAFRQHSPSTGPLEPKPLGRQKKIVITGKWCGKVWMSNQVHPLLTGVQEEQETKNLAFSKVGTELENQPVITESGISKNARKRKRTERRSATLKVMFQEAKPLSSPPPSADDFPLHGGFRRQPRTSLKNKKIRKEALHPRLIILSSEEDNDIDNSHDREASRTKRRRTIKPAARDFRVWTKPKQEKVKRVSAVEDIDSDRDHDLEANQTKPTARDFRLWSKWKQKKAPLMEDIDSDSDHEANRIMKRSTNKPPAKEFRVWSEPKQNKVKIARATEPVETEEDIDVWPLECPFKWCGMTFKCTWALAEHIRAHSGECSCTCKEEWRGQAFRLLSDFSCHKQMTGYSVNKGKTLYIFQTTKNTDWEDDGLSESEHHTDTRPEPVVASNTNWAAVDDKDDDDGIDATQA